MTEPGDYLGCLVSSRGHLIPPLALATEAAQDQVQGLNLATVWLQGSNGRRPAERRKSALSCYALGCGRLMLGAPDFWRKLKGPSRGPEAPPHPAWAWLLADLSCCQQGAIWRSLLSKLFIRLFIFPDLIRIRAT